MFINYINHARLNYGGGQSKRRNHFGPSISPLNVLNFLTTPFLTVPLRPFLRIQNRSKYTTFSENRYQDFGSFVPDYQRIGPEIIGNTLLDNSRNGFVY